MSHKRQYLEHLRDRTDSRPHGKLSSEMRTDAKQDSCLMGKRPDLQKWPGNSLDIGMFE